jgi:hypothetical protein
VYEEMDGWAPSERHPTWLYYREAGKLLAGYEPETGHYMRHIGNGHWQDAEAPHDKPLPNFGLDSTRLNKGPSYSVNGRTATKEEAVRALEGQLADDRTKYRLTVIGDDAVRKQVVSDLETSQGLSAFRDRHLVQSYAPDNWAAQKFQAAGNPTVILQAPDGAVVHRQEDYRDGAAGLAKALTSAYDPKKDPDRRKNPLANLDPKTLAAGGGVLALIAAAFLLITGRKPAPVVVAPHPTVEAVASASATAATAAMQPIVNPILELLRDHAAERKQAEDERGKRDAEHAELKAYFKELTT